VTFLAGLITGMPTGHSIVSGFPTHDHSTRFCINRYQNIIHCKSMRLKVFEGIFDGIFDRFDVCEKNDRESLRPFFERFDVSIDEQTGEDYSMNLSSLNGKEAPFAIRGSTVISNSNFFFHLWVTNQKGENKFWDDDKWAVWHIFIFNNTSCWCLFVLTAKKCLYERNNHIFTVFEFVQFLYRSCHAIYERSQWLRNVWVFKILLTMFNKKRFRKKTFLACHKMNVLEKACTAMGEKDAGRTGERDRNDYKMAHRRGTEGIKWVGFVSDILL